MTLTLDMMVPGATFTNDHYTFTITKVEGDDLWYKFDHWDKDYLPKEGYQWNKINFLNNPGIAGQGYEPVIDESELWE